MQALAMNAAQRKDVAVAVAVAVADPLLTERARAFAEPLLSGQQLDTGEDVLAHADGMVVILGGIGAAPALCAASYLVYASEHLQRPEEAVRKAFGDSQASLVMLTRKLVQIQRAARRTPRAAQGSSERALQTERVRKMLLAFSHDLRVVLLRLASRLQTLRFHATARKHCPADLATESAQVFAPLASRLGIWQIKWELEDLAFRFLQPSEYQRMARLVDQTRTERETGVQQARQALMELLARAGITSEVHGRPKHLYSIWKKMQGKGVGFARVFDARALRVVVADVPACYATLACVHEAWAPITGEFDDYIARPKNNGYQSLHSVVSAADGRPVEVQIRTQEMHAHAEHGVAAHWVYKEAGAKGYAGVSATGEAADRVAEARKAVLRELLAWEREFVAEGQAGAVPNAAHSDANAAGAAADAPLDAPGDPQVDTPADAASAISDRIYVFTPQATIIDLPAGGTPVDFAYTLHTDLGHRCRGAKVDGRVVPLNTPLHSGQTVEVVAAKEGGPSLDWLNPDSAYLKSPRARAKVRAWFNAQALGQTIARGRELVEKLLQREGRTALKLDALAEQLGFDKADALFEVVGKDELSLRTIENLLRPTEPTVDEDRVILHRPRSEAGGGRGGVLVLGVDSLLTTLARCCRPAPPDDIRGFVTRGRGVAIHRAGCSNLVHMAHDSPGRVIDVQWSCRSGSGGENGNGNGNGGGGGGGGGSQTARPAMYPLDVLVEASDRQGLLRDIGEVFAKERMNVTGIHTQNARQRGTAWMTITAETTDTARLSTVLTQLSRIAGVRQVRRK